MFERPLQIILQRSFFFWRSPRSRGSRSRVGLSAATPHATAIPTLLRGFRCYPYRETQLEIVRKIPGKNTKFAHYLNIQ